MRLQLSRSLKIYLVVSAALALITILAFCASTIVLRAHQTTVSGEVTIQGLLNFTNKNRATPLVLDERLNRSAQAKCEDMVAKNYWSHDAPDGTTPWTFIKNEIGYNPNGTWGENLMENPGTSKGAVDWWMGSPKHRENIENKAFRSVGFGICTSHSYSGSNGLPATIVVQHFAS